MCKISSKKVLVILVSKLGTIVGKMAAKLRRVCAAVTLTIKRLEVAVLFDAEKRNSAGCVRRYARSVPRRSLGTEIGCLMKSFSGSAVLHCKVQTPVPVLAYTGVSLSQLLFRRKIRVITVGSP